ncbi:MAG: aminopeptidase P family protein [Bacteroidaceae bacterium]|nr:aminopeptidase P family protein [Bacteroidaceae bacterium]
MTKAAVITGRVEALRKWMRWAGISAYIFPSTDPHSGEYVPDHWKGREWISGFNGSAGTAVVTLHAAGLWTDSRYWLAAEEQTADTPFEVIRCGRNVATAEELVEWIKGNMEKGNEGACKEGASVGLDASSNTTESVEELKEQLALYGLTITYADPLVDIWSDRPAVPEAPIEIQPLELAGCSVAQKMASIREELSKNRADALVVSQLDEIAWALNLRGTDVHCTPVFVSYLLILPQKTVLYVDRKKVTPEVATYLADNGIDIHSYYTLNADLADGHVEGLPLKSLCIQFDPATTNYAICDSLSICGATVVRKSSPITALRAIKNEVEIAGFRRAMLKDGVAMVKFLRWISEQSFTNYVGERLTEITVDQKLTALRAEQEGFRDISFDTIAGYGAHAAIVHYEATPETDIPLEPHGLLLLDSGAQYQDGTTDITRTIPLGPLTDNERRDYTLVLKGHIRLATAVFPQGTTGTQLDVLARYAMWQEHKNYGHGTGHGVGSYLSVHEGPHQFRMNWMPAPLQAGMTVTIEPGIYIAGSHGVRTENTMLIVDSPALQGEGSWLCLEPLTLCPIDTRPIVREFMASDEIEYLNNYHARVREALLPLLDDEADRQWLIHATEPFP